jgi:hypothetical protein
LLAMAEGHRCMTEAFVDATNEAEGLNNPTCG